MRKVKINNDNSVGNHHNNDGLGIFEVKRYAWLANVYLSRVRGIFLKAWIGNKPLRLNCSFLEAR